MKGSREVGISCDWEEEEEELEVEKEHLSLAQHPPEDHPGAGQAAVPVVRLADRRDVQHDSGAVWRRDRRTHGQAIAANTLNFRQTAARSQTHLPCRCQ